MRSALVRDITQRWVVVLCRRFGKTYRPNLQGSWPLKMGRIGCPEKSVHNSHSTLRNIPEERKSHKQTKMTVRPLPTTAYLKARGADIFQKSRSQKGEMKQVRYEVSINIRHHHTKFSRPGDLVSGNCAPLFKLLTSHWGSQKNQNNNIIIPPYPYRLGPEIYYCTS